MKFGNKDYAKVIYWILQEAFNGPARVDLKSIPISSSPDFVDLVFWMKLGNHNNQNFRVLGVEPQVSSFGENYAHN